MLEIHLSGETLASPSSPILPLPAQDRPDEHIHVTLSDNGTLKVAANLWIELFTDTRLRALSLVDLQLYENDARILANSIKDGQNLAELSLSSVRLSVFGFDHLLNNGLQPNRSIRQLTLSNLSKPDVSTIAGLIKNNTSIQHLSLVNDDISPDGIAIIADALRSSSTLISLDLSRNRVDKRGALALADVPRHPSLTHINVSDCEIDEESRRALLQCQNGIRIIFSPEIEPILPPEQFVEESPSPLQSTSRFRYVTTALVTFLFFLWGVPNQLNDVLIRQFRKALVLSDFESGLVQSAFYMGYFLWALPAAYVLRCWGYKIGLILGLVLFGSGAFLFWPAAIIGQYIPFLIALFIIATGLAFLETAANPFIAHAAGPAYASHKRLNFAQAFNPLGAITGALVGTLFIFSGVELSTKETNAMRKNGTYDAYLKDERERVVRPYIVLGCVALVWALFIAFAPFPPNTKPNKTEKERKRNDHTVGLCRPLFLLAIVAQFAYVGAQVGTWSYFIQYAKNYCALSEKISGYWLTGTLGMFAIGRLLAALLIHFGVSAAILLATFALINVLLIALSVTLPGSIGFGTLFCTSFFMSLMFPTIFTLGIKGMNSQTTKLASCLLVMAIVGGAAFTPLMGFISVRTGHLYLAYILPGVAYLVIAFYALLTYVLTSGTDMES